MNDKGYFTDGNTYQIENGSYTFWGQREEPLSSQKPMRPRCKLTRVTEYNSAYGWSCKIPGNICGMHVKSIKAYSLNKLPGCKNIIIPCHVEFVEKHSFVDLPSLENIYIDSDFCDFRDNFILLNSNKNKDEVRRINIKCHPGTLTEESLKRLHPRSNIEISINGSILKQRSLKNAIYGDEYDER